MKPAISKPFPLPVPMIRFFRSPAVFALFLIFFAVVSSVTAQQKNDPDVAAKPQPGFLEIARDPDATTEQKRTVAAMMDFVTETDPIAAFEKLKASDSLVLYGDGADGLSDLTPVSQLIGLKTLILYNHRISDLTPLGSLGNLQTLRLELNQIRDISSLANLRKLESLQIDDNLITDLRPLSDLSQLRTLWISRNRISDVSPLKGLMELRDLHLTGNKVTDLKVFAEMSLCTLHLGGNGITDLSDLREMNQKTTCFIALDLSDNAIRDIGPIGKLGKVSSLNLANNRISDAGALHNPALTVLDLQGNQLSRAPDFLDLKLFHLNLQRNPINDYADLVAFKKGNPRMEILADEEFTRAFENSFPVEKKLEGSPLLGAWRTARLETEWGPMLSELRFKSNGVFYQKMLTAEPEQEDEFSADGQFSIRSDRLEMTIQGDTSERRFEIKDGILTLEADGEKVSFSKVAE